MWPLSALFDWGTACIRLLALFSSLKPFFFLLKCLNLKNSGWKYGREWGCHDSSPFFWVKLISIYIWSKEDDRTSKHATLVLSCHFHRNDSPAFREGVPNRKYRLHRWCQRSRALALVLLLLLSDQPIPERVFIGQFLIRPVWREISICKINLNQIIQKSKLKRNRQDEMRFYIRVEFCPDTFLSLRRFW